jgi:hypothetical protein
MFYIDDIGACHNNSLSDELSAKNGLTEVIADQSWIAILLIRLAFTPALLADFGPNSGLIVPKLFPTWWGGVNP